MANKISAQFTVTECLVCLRAGTTYLYQRSEVSNNLTRIMTYHSDLNVGMAEQGRLGGLEVGG